MVWQKMPIFLPNFLFNMAFDICEVMFKGHCFHKTTILQAVYFKLRFLLSYRDIEELLRIRGVLYFNVECSYQSSIKVNLSADWTRRIHQDRKNSRQFFL